MLGLSHTAQGAQYDELQTTHTAQGAQYVKHSNIKGFTHIASFRIVCKNDTASLVLPEAALFTSDRLFLIQLSQSASK